MAEIDDDLRAPLVPAFERLTTDLVVGTHGDPHVAFTVLVYPDREPSIIALTPKGDCAFSRLLDAKEKNADHGPGRFFSREDLKDADNALGDARSALSTAHWRRDESKLGDYITAAVRKGYVNRREARSEAILKQAAWDEAHRFVCEVCGHGYTERGVKIHQAKVWHCRDELARRRESAAVDVVQSSAGREEGEEQ